MVALIGITGGIGAGKSSFSKLLRAIGYPVVDADILSRDVLAFPKIQQQINELFGLSVFSSGAMDRVLVRKLVFENPSLREGLERIIHPAVAELIAQKKQLLAEVCSTAWLFYEVPLLFEAGREKDFDAVVVVTAQEAIRRERLLRSRPLSSDEVERIMRAQLPEEQKCARADFVIDNSFGPEDLERSCRCALDFLQGKFSSRS